MNKNSCSFSLGVTVGVMAGFLIYPKLSRNVKKSIKKAKRNVINGMYDTYDTAKQKIM